MPETPPILELDLAENGGILVFKSPGELQSWNKAEEEKWRWIYDHAGARAQTERLWQQYSIFHTEVNQRAQQWRSQIHNAPEISRTLQSIRKLFSDFYLERKILNSQSAPANFVFDIKNKRGPSTAAGACISILSSPIPLHGEVPAEFWHGLIEGFLFAREVDWTASAHSRALDQLKAQYQEELGTQRKRATEIEDRNRTLNEAFAATLTEKGNNLEKLHGEQNEQFKALTEKHVGNLKGIEDAYDQKLALQKPVEYWDSRQKYHQKRSFRFGITGLAVGLVAVGGLGCLVYWVFSRLAPTDNPRHWQVGILVVAAFFAVWIVRIFVRLFFSHLHLATDAAERRTMILTYLAMAREGAEVKPEDKKLILQHIFRSASDGLVKDDAAPPSLWEWPTRGK